MFKGQAPFDLEVDAQVAKEYKRINEKKCKVCPYYAREIEEVRTRV